MDELEQRVALEKTLQARLLEAEPREVAAISKELRAVWAEIEAIERSSAVEADDDLKLRRERVNLVTGRASTA